MRAFLDTEFIETSVGPQFLSVGMCLMDGREFYLEIKEHEVAALVATYSSNFLKSNVVNQLGRTPEAQASLDEMSRRFKAWVDGLGCAELEVVYDFSTDYLLVEQLVERMDGALRTRLVPTHVAYLLEDPAGIRAADETWAIVASSRGLQQHHALADSLALAARFKAVHGAGEQGPT